MVSMERAAQCIGRKVVHVTNIEVQGTVDKVGQYDVWVKTRDGERIPCIPENLSWKANLHPDLAEAIRTNDFYHDAQVGYHPAVEEDGLGSEMGFLYSSASANDDDSDHCLYIVCHGMRTAYRARMTAHPDLGYEIEELMGWAKP